MTDKSKEAVGFLGICSALLAMASLFTGGLSSVFIGSMAVLAGFFGVKKKQIFSQTGMILGAISLIFFNFVSMGIIKPSLSQSTGKGHLANAIYSSINAFDLLKNTDLEDDEKIIINAFKNGLEEAGLVNIEKIETEVPGFAAHFRNEFINGMRLLIEGYEDSDTAKKLQGGMLLDKWGKWSNENNHKLDLIKEPSLSIISFVKGIMTK